MIRARKPFTFSVNLLDFCHLFVVSGAHDLDEGLLVRPEALKQRQAVSAAWKQPCAHLRCF